MQEVETSRILLSDYLNDKIGFKEFTKRFIPLVWDIDSDFVYSVKLVMFEHSNGHWTEEGMKSKLKVILDKF